MAGANVYLTKQQLFIVREALNQAIAPAKEIWVKDQLLGVIMKVDAAIIKSKGVT